MSEAWAPCLKAAHGPWASLGRRSGLEEAGRFGSRRHLRRLRFSGSHLWVAGRRWARVYDLSEAEAPELVGEVSGDRVRWVDRRLVGRLVVGLARGRVTLEEAVAP